MEGYFIFVWVLVAIYVILGNYLYFYKVLPALDKSPSGTPWGQLRDTEDYLGIISRREEFPWFCYYLKHIKLVSLVVFLLMVPVILNLLGVLL